MASHAKAMYLKLKAERQAYQSRSELAKAAGNIKDQEFCQEQISRLNKHIKFYAGTVREFGDNRAERASLGDYD